MKIVLESTGNRVDHVEERISELEDGNLELIQVEEKRELFFFNGESVLEQSNFSRKSNIRTMGIPEGEEGRRSRELIYRNNH